MNLKTKIIVANTGESSLSIIDPSIQKEIQRIKLISGTGPYDLAKSSLDGCILVTQYYEGTVMLVEISTGKVLESIYLGRCPSYIVYNENEDSAFISNCDSNSISIISVSRMKLIGQISVGFMPRDLDLEPCGEDLVVANADSKELWFIDSRGFFVKGKIGLRHSPFYVKYSRDGSCIFTSCSADGDENMGIITMVDTATFEVIDIITTKGLPGQMYTTQDGRYLLLTSLGRGGVDIFKMPGGKLVKNIPTNGMTHGIVSDLEERYIYVTNPDDNSVSIVDLSLDKKNENIKVGKEPNGIIII